MEPNEKNRRANQGNFIGLDSNENPYYSDLESTVYVSIVKGLFFLGEHYSTTILRFGALGFVGGDRDQGLGW